MMPGKLCRAVAGALLVFVLSACGGGGGGGTGSSGSGGATNAPPRFTSPTSYTFAEDQLVSFYLEVTDPDGDTITIRDDAGGDGAWFAIDPASGLVSTTTNNGKLNFEQPLDNNGDNVYEQRVTLSDGKTNVSTVISVTITDANDAPTCSLGAEAEFYENQTGVVYTFDGVDEDTRPEFLQNSYINLSVSADPITGWISQEVRDSIALNETSGEVSIITPIDAEWHNPSTRLHLQVSYGENGLADNCDVRLGLIDIEPTVSSGIKIKGEQQASTNVGDIDNDGIDELWIQSTRRDENAADQPGGYLVFGSALSEALAGGSGGEIDLVAGGEGIIHLFANFPALVAVTQFNDGETFVARAINDVDGDGVPELLVGLRPGAVALAPSKNANRPYTYLIWGSTLLSNTDGEIDILSLTPADALVISGPGGVSRESLDVTSGDFDGDGWPDIAVSTPEFQIFSDGRDGRTFVVFRDALLAAKSSGQLRVDNNNDVAEFSDPNGGILSSAGFEAASIGDVDGDGLDDLLLGALRSHNAVLFGSEISSVQRVNPNSFFGHVVTLAFEGQMPRLNRQPFDIDDDGIVDILFGVQIGRAHGFAQSIGGAFVRVLTPVSGGEQIDTTISNPGVVSFQKDLMDEYGMSGVTSIGDIDGDGRDDIAIGLTANQDSRYGSVYVLLGSTVVAQAGTAFDVDSLAPGQGIEINGVHQTDRIGYGLSSLSDLDGDGLQELVIVSSHAEESYVVFSSDILAGLSSGDLQLQLSDFFEVEVPSAN